MKKLYLFIATVLAVVLIFNSGAVYGVEFETINISWEGKIEPYLLEVMENATGKIPVSLWMKDIDHEKVEEKVYEKTGLRESNLSVVREPMSEQLAVDVANLSSSDATTKQDTLSRVEMYLNKTKESRELESKRVDTYLKELYAVQDDFLQKSNASIFSELDIETEDIIQTDTGAPMYVVYLNKEDIIRLAKHNKVTALYYYDLYGQVTTTDETNLVECLQATTLDRIYDEVGLSGTGIKVGFIETGRIQAHDEIDSSRITYVSQSVDKYASHATRVARIAVGSNGVASGAAVYSASVSTMPQLTNAITSLTDEWVSVINMSMGGNYERKSVYTAYEAAIDYVVKTKKVTVVAAAGNIEGDNNNGKIIDPAAAYNVITVGSYLNQSTEDPTDDCYFSLGSYDNTYDNIEGCSKPEIIANQPSYTINGNTYNGTSYAAPVVSGTVALLQELCPTLKIQPETVKAILMASCHRKVIPNPSSAPTETMEQGITDRQGAGTIDPYLAVSIVGSGNYGVRIMDSTETQNQIRFRQPIYNSTGLNVSVAWIKGNTSETAVGPDINLDLTLIRNGSQVKTSTLGVSSSEMTYVVPSSTLMNYIIQVDRISTDNTDVKYAYAFSVNNTRYQYRNVCEGVYYLKNRATGMYLTRSSTDNSLYQSAFANSPRQQWVITNNQISSVSTENKRIAIGSSIDGSYYSAITDTSTGAYTECQINSSGGNQIGSVTLRSSNRAIGIYNESVSSGAEIAWSTYSLSNQYQKWFLEPVAYQNGDIDLDGAITLSDGTMISQYSVDKITLSDLQIFLADVNGDDDIDANDTLAVNQIANENV